jgi:hypothetical protein
MYGCDLTLQLQLQLVVSLEIEENSGDVVISYRNHNTVEKSSKLSFLSTADRRPMYGCVKFSRQKAYVRRWENQQTGGLCTSV